LQGKDSEFIGRFGLGIVFLISGIHKVMDYSGTQWYMNSMGVSEALLPLVITIEIVGATALILGWHIRIAALVLAVFSLLTALLFHADLQSQVQMTMFLKNIAIAGGLLVICGMGAGGCSLDAKQQK
jgi:putative oxidoreductase